jgi:hypothetical protein
MPNPVLEPVDLHNIDTDPIGTSITYEMVIDGASWPGPVISVKRMGWVETDFGKTIAPYQFGVIREPILPVRIYLRDGEGFVMFSTVKEMLRNGWTID